VRRCKPCLWGAIGRGDAIWLAGILNICLSLVTVGHGSVIGVRYVISPAVSSYLIDRVEKAG